MLGGALAHSLSCLSTLRSALHPCMLAFGPMGRCPASSVPSCVRLYDCTALLACMGVVWRLGGLAALSLCPLMHPGWCRALGSTCKPPRLYCLWVPPSLGLLQW